MKIYIQSKSGDFNAVLDVTTTLGLTDAFNLLQTKGYYVTQDRKNRDIVVPFSEIEFIREYVEGD